MAMNKKRKKKSPLLSHRPASVEINGLGTINLTADILLKAVQNYFDAKMFLPGKSPRVSGMEISSDGTFKIRVYSWDNWFPHLCEDCREMLATAKSFDGPEKKQ